MDNITLFVFNGKEITLILHSLFTVTICTIYIYIYSGAGCDKTYKNTIINHKTVDKILPIPIKYLRYKLPIRILIIMVKHPPKLTFLIPINPHKITSLLFIHKSLGEQLTINFNLDSDILSLQRNSFFNNILINPW